MKYRYKTRIKFPVFLMLSIVNFMHSEYCYYNYEKITSMITTYCLALTLKKLTHLITIKRKRLATTTKSLLNIQEHRNLKQCTIHQPVSLRCSRLNNYLKCFVLSSWIIIFLVKVLCKQCEHYINRMQNKLLMFMINIYLLVL